MRGNDPDDQNDADLTLVAAPTRERVECDEREQDSKEVRGHIFVACRSTPEGAPSMDEA